MAVNPMDEATNDDGSTANQNPKSFIMDLTYEDMHIDKLLGTGSFAKVYQVRPHRAIRPLVTANRTSGDGKKGLKSQNLHDKHNNTELRGPTAATEQAVYALKQVSPKEPAQAPEAAAGLLTELVILCDLPSHEHIIRLYGHSRDIYQDPTQGFVLLERLDETLEERLRRWRNSKARERSSRNLARRLWHAVVDPASSNSKHRAKQEWEQLHRISQTGLGVAKAMSFLHKHKVLYRDLKPGNIGFDQQGQVRLFDFGLSKPIYRQQQEEDADKRTTLCVGTLRYMSPEVADGHPYCYASDVHSFAMLLWEICVLQKPFSDVKTADDYLKWVVLQKKRPSLRGIHSSDIKELLEVSWHPNPDLRPSFASVVNVLENCSRNQELQE